MVLMRIPVNSQSFDLVYKYLIKINFLFEKCELIVLKITVCVVTCTCISKTVVISSCVDNRFVMKYC